MEFENTEQSKQSENQEIDTRNEILPNCIESLGDTKETLAEAMDGLQEIQGTVMDVCTALKIPLPEFSDPAYVAESTPEIFWKINDVIYKIEEATRYLDRAIELADLLHNSSSSQDSSSPSS